MSFSTSTVCPPALLDATSRDRMQEPRDVGTHGSQPAQHISPTTLIDPNRLSPFAPKVHSNSASPSSHNANTPGESVSNLSEPYQSSDFSELDDDPFFGVNFNNTDGGTPSFLDDLTPPLGQDEFQGAPFDFGTLSPSGNAREDTTYPLSPDPTPSLNTTPPHSERRSPRALPTDPLPESISPHQLSKASQDSATLSSSSHGFPQLSPDTSTSASSSEDGAAPGAPTMTCPSPRVTVSLWGNDGSAIHSIDAAVHNGVEDSDRTRVGPAADASFAPSLHIDAAESSSRRDETGAWVPDAQTGQRGLDPARRASGEVTSVNDLAAQRQRQERNSQVGDWLSKSEGDLAHDTPPVRTDVGEASDVRLPRAEVPFGDTTENRELPGQTYYLENGGEITREDIEIMRQNRNWADAPVLFPISRDSKQRYQPESSQAAIERFQRMCQDNESIVSRAATWGTRRLSLPSVADFEGVTSGNFLKKLSISRGEPRRQSIFKDLRGLVRKPSARELLKRNRTSPEEEQAAEGDSENRRESQSSLAPPARSMSWGKKPMPSINTALASMGANVASIGTTHARSGSISNATPVTSPKSPFNLAVPVKSRLSRPRSKSDLPKSIRGSSDASTSKLVDMWKKTGGPPVASLAKGAPLPDQDDDEDDEDEFDEETDTRGEASKLIDEITPDVPGFRKQVLQQNPMLSAQHTYLVDRIAYQQQVRYKTLLQARQRHLRQAANRTCPCGPSLCIALGGSATPLDTKGDPRALDALSSRYDGSDGDMTPLEGAISSESFPQDIPLPPTTTLPAEFECQLCYQTKKFQKPSDWTKHVHEDVQPFTCTWDRCREPKVFKRKADWVRHENEGHRHLEWWTCDVDDCRHVCFRRDNFLQHLVREHRFPEPKVKTKAAIKKAGGTDQTWQKVELCHMETNAKPQEEPCRFCGKTFTTWKKLTVHLAKHMEQMSLPVLRLVAKAQLETDTLISPVHDPPPRTFAPPVKHEPQAYNAAPSLNRMPVQQQPPNAMVYANAQQEQYYQPVQQVQAGHFQPQPYYPGTSPFEDLPQNLNMMTMGTQHPLNTGYANQHAAYHGMPVTAGPFVPAPNHYMAAAPNLEPFPSLPMNALGLQDPAAMGQLPYDGMMDSSGVGPDQFTPHGSVHGGSVSPFSHSPHQPQGPFYPQ